MPNLADVSYTANGAVTTFVVTFSYIEIADVTVTLDGVATTAYTWSDASTIEMNTAPANGVIVKISRDSDVTQRIVAFSDGAAFTAEDLNNSSNQSIYLQQETRDLISTINAVNAGVDSRVTTNETDIDELELNQGDLVTLSGVAENATDLGTFTGTTITDSQTVKAAMQEVETAVEANADDIATNVSDIVEANATIKFTARVNETGGVVKGDIVYISGSSGTRIEVSKAINTDYSKIEAIAVATETISNNSDGVFQSFGRFDTFDTSSWTEGDTLYLSSTSGEITNVSPTGIQAVMEVGTVSRSHASLGIIFIHIEYWTQARNYDGIVRETVVNTSSGTSAQAAVTLVNNAGHKLSLALTGAGHTVAEAVTMYNEGYGDTYFTVDGNNDFVFLTDATDSHNFSATEKARLTAAGEFQAKSLDINSSTSVDGVLDEDTMVSNSATKLATQQSIKAYADTKAVQGDIDTHAALTASHGVTEIVGTSEAATLTNKTFDDEITMQEIATPATPAAGYKSIYPKTDGKLYSLDDAGNEVEIGSGAGGGSINYMNGDNSDAEISVGDWVAYADAAGANPVDGTGGAPTVTIARSVDTSLRGAANLLVTKDAANRQGEGTSCAFTVDEADKAKMLTISFDYTTSANYADDDIRLSVYDVTNSQLIRINGEDLKAVSGSGKHYAQFQTSSDSTSYRLIAHVSSTNAAAYTVRLDGVQVGPREIARGAIVTEWEDYTPDIVGIGADTLLYSQWRRVGDSVEVNIKFTTGSTTATEFQVPLPVGISVSSDVSSISAVGVGQRAASTDNHFIVLATGGDSFVNMGTRGSGGNSTFTASNGSSLYGNTENGSINFTVPIQGWASSGTVNEDLGGGDVVVTGKGNSGGAVSTTVAYDFTEVLDATSSWDGDSFTVPETGNYIINGAVYLTTSASRTINLYVDGVLEFEDGVGVNTTRAAFKFSGHFIKDQVLDIRPNSAATENNGDADRHWISINKLASGSQKFETATVAARYTSNSGQAFTNNLVLEYEDLDYDTHGAYNTLTGEYTVPVSGKYLIHSRAQTDAESWSVTQQAGLIITLNGADYAMVREFGATASSAKHPSITEIVDLVKGDLIGIEASSSISTNMSTTAIFNSFSIARIK